MLLQLSWSRDCISSWARLRAFATIASNPATPSNFVTGLKDALLLLTLLLFTSWDALDGSSLGLWGRRWGGAVSGKVAWLPERFSPPNTKLTRFWFQFSWSNKILIQFWHDFDHFSVILFFSTGSSCGHWEQLWSLADGVPRVGNLIQNQDFGRRKLHFERFWHDFSIF